MTMRSSPGTARASNEIDAGPTVRSGTRRGLLIGLGGATLVSLTGGTDHYRAFGCRFCGERLELASRRLRLRDHAAAVGEREDRHEAG